MNSSQKPETAAQFFKGFLDQTINQGNKGILYRGLSDATREVSSSLYRRLSISGCVDSQPDVKIRQIHRDANEKIIKSAEHQGYHSESGGKLNTLKTLANLQHYGVATGLIDFTRNPLVALWFACQKINDEEANKNAQCKVVAIDSSDDNVYKIISEGIDKELDELFKGDTIWVWQPPKQNNRIIAQHSEFVIGEHIIKTDNEFLIPSNFKNDILVELEKYDISDNQLFCDFDGFTRINAHNRHYNCEPDYAADAKIAAQSGDYKDAKKLYDRAIKKVKDNEKLYNERGLAKHELGDYKGAIKDFDKATELRSEYTEAYYNRGRAKDELGDYEGAIEDYDNAIKSNPSDADAYRNRGYAKGELGDYKGAIEDYDNAIKLNPNDADAYFNRSYSKGELGDHEGAIKDLDNTIKLNPNDAVAYYNRSYAKGKLGDHEGAIKDLVNVIKLNPNDADAYYNRGVTKGKLGDHEGATEDYDNTIKLNPKYIKAYFNRGYAKSKLSDYEGATEDFDNAIKLNPKYANAYYNRGFARYHSNDKKGALADFTKANELDSTCEIPSISFDD